MTEQKIATNKKRCYSVTELVEILEISKPAVYELLKKKVFQWVMVSGKYRISKRSFDAWLDGAAAEQEYAEPCLP